MTNIQKIIEDVFMEVSKLENKGKNSSSIPLLSKQDPNILSISIVTCKGNKYNIGDYDKKIPIESISKVFTLAFALNNIGIEEINKKIGFKPSFLSYDSVISLKLTKTHRVNPFVNQGAIATISLVKSIHKKNDYMKIFQFINKVANDKRNKLSFNKKIYKSEMSNNQHNLGLTYLLDSWKGMYSDVDKSVETYTKLCSIEVNSQNIAIMAATLANGGINPITKEKLIKKENIKYILSLMLSEGLYQESGKWSIYVGVPAKSGIGGGIMLVSPNKYGIGIVSPPLNDSGNSYMGWEIAKRLSEKLKLNIFNGY